MPKKKSPTQLTTVKLSDASRERLKTLAAELTFKKGETFTSGDAIDWLLDNRREIEDPKRKGK